MPDLLIAEQHRVTLHFGLYLEDGSVVDDNFAAPPASLVIGDETLPENFEAKLIGLKAGDTESFTLQASDAFGDWNEQNTQRFRRHQFGVDYPLEVGLVVSFADAAGAELPGTVTKIDGDEVLVDFNHPLAGKTVHFRVHIVSVEVL